MEEKKWFYALGGERMGPVALGELRVMARRGSLPPDGLVWQPDFGSEWRKAAGAPGLADAFPTRPAATAAEPLPMPTTPDNTGPGNASASPGPSGPASGSGSGSSGTASAFGSGNAAGLGPGSAASDPGPGPGNAGPASGPVPPAGAAGRPPRVLAAAGMAWRRTVDVLFRSFSFRRWFSIGFCAWLASAGNGGGGGRGGAAASPPDLSRIDLDAARRNIQDGLAAVKGHLADPRILSLAAAALLVILLCFAVFFWINSRGVFMFLHRWYRPDAGIRESWAVSREPGRGLFLWRLGFMAVCLLLFAGFAAAAWHGLAAPFLADRIPPAALFPALLAWSGGGILLIFLTFIVSRILLDFVAPVMYARRIGVLQAWAAVLPLFGRHPFRLIGFYLFMMALFLGFSLGILLIVLGTCCIALILLALPYVGAVFLLPVLYFLRGLPVCYLAQWRPDLLPAE